MKRPALLLLSLLLPGLLPAETPAPAAAPAAASEYTLPPAAEAALTEFSNKLIEAKRLWFRSRMKTLARRVAQVTGADAATTQALEEAGNRAADHSLEIWRPRMLEYWRRSLSGMGEQAVRELNLKIARLDDFVRTWTTTEFPNPPDDEGWLAALRKHLTPEQAELWRKEDDAARARTQREIETYLRARTTRTREELTQPIRAIASELKTMLPATPETAKKLDALVRQVGDEAVKQWNGRAARSLTVLDDEQRQDVIRQNRFYLPVEEPDSLERQPQWTEGLAAIVPPEDLARWRTAQEEHRARRAHSLSLMLVSLLDDRLALTAKQRESLLPLAEKLAGVAPNLNPGSGSPYLNLSPDIFYEAAAPAKEEELTPILDTVQIARWRELCVPRQRVRSARQVAVVPAPDETAPPASPEDAEKAISDQLYRLTSRMRAQWLSPLLLQVEDAARVTGLPEIEAIRLKAAARGATEQALEEWKISAEQNVRSGLTELTPAAVKQRMATTEDAMLNMRVDPPAEKRPLWQRGLIYTLTAEQQELWQKELDARTDFRSKAVTATVMAEFDRRNLLTGDQCSRLEPMLLKTISEYGPDFSAFNSSNDQMPWYLRSYLMMVPFASIPEGTLRAVLTKEQWERWSTSNDFATATNFWTNIRQNHRRRANTRF